MSQENVEVLRGSLAIFNRGDKDAWLAICDPELENVPSREWPETEPVRGAEAVWGFLREINEIWDGAEFEWGELIDAGRDKVVVNQRAETRGRTSGVVLAFSFWIVVVTFQGGKMARFEWFAERSAALEAAGLSE